MTLVTRLETDKKQLDRTRIATHRLDEPVLGEAIVRIDSLAVTANNITYAAFGAVPSLRYWQFFPTGEDAWGNMPAWGFANVVSSTVEGVEVGERFYGFWPIASHLVVKPGRVSERGFYDVSPHRLELTSAYNQYQRVTSDAGYRPEHEDYQMLLRPLFITSFMLADFLEDNAFFGAEQLVISSASSKTAYGTAFCLQQSSQIPRRGVTSDRNCAFVSSLGCYDETLGYGSITSLDANCPTLYVDFSGDDRLRRSLHEHFADSLVYDCYAGSAQSHAHLGTGLESLVGPKPRAYFAPIQIKKRNADWGAEEVTRRFNEAQVAFIRRVSDPASPWIRVREHAGFEAGQRWIRDLVAGRFDPCEGHVLRLR